MELSLKYQPVQELVWAAEAAAEGSQQADVVEMLAGAITIGDAVQVLQPWTLLRPGDRPLARWEEVALAGGRSPVPPEASGVEAHVGHAAVGLAEDIRVMRSKALMSGAVRDAAALFTSAGNRLLAAQGLTDSPTGQAVKKVVAAPVYDRTQEFFHWPSIEAAARYVNLRLPWTFRAKHRFARPEYRVSEAVTWGYDALSMDQLSMETTQRLDDALAAVTLHTVGDYSRTIAPSELRPNLAVKLAQLDLRESLSQLAALGGPDPRWAKTLARRHGVAELAIALADGITELAPRTDPPIVAAAVVKSARLRADRVVALSPQ